MPIAVHRTADIHKLPPGATSLNDRGYHYHCLLRECDEGEIATLAWGSSKRTILEAGGCAHTVRPQRLGLSANGLRVDTHFHGSVIVLCDESELGARVGKMLKELSRMRACLRNALGIGTGLADARYPQSRRGQVVRLKANGPGPNLPINFGLVVTAHRYSEAAQYQIVVPVVEGGVGIEVGTHVVRRADEDWVGAIFPGVNEALLVTPLTFSVWEEDSVDNSSLPMRADQYTLDRVEEELRSFFRLDDQVAATAQ